MGHSSRHRPHHQWPKRRGVQRGRAAGDSSFDPYSTGDQVINLNRSDYDPTTGTSKCNPRQQINTITAWIDGSVVYGCIRKMPARCAFRARCRQTQSSPGDLLPYNTDGLTNANDAHLYNDDELFLAGDVRANENIELTSLQTLFMREHNRLADQIAASQPGLSDEAIYQTRARRIVIAEIQSITYNEFLPALLGNNPLSAYAGYKSNVNPGIANEFSTAAFRLGHSTCWSRSSSSTTMAMKSATSCHWPTRFSIPR